MEEGIVVKAIMFLIILVVVIGAISVLYKPAYATIKDLKCEYLSQFCEEYVEAKENFISLVATNVLDNFVGSLQQCVDIDSVECGCSFPTIDERFSIILKTVDTKTIIQIFDLETKKLIEVDKKPLTKEIEANFNCFVSADKTIKRINEELEVYYTNKPLQPTITIQNIGRYQLDYPSGETNVFPLYKKSSTDICFVSSDYAYGSPFLKKSLNLNLPLCVGKEYKPEEETILG